MTDSPVGPTEFKRLIKTFCLLNSLFKRRKKKHKTKTAAKYLSARGVIQPQTVISPQVTVSYKSLDLIFSSSFYLFIFHL